MRLGVHASKTKVRLSGVQRLKAPSILCDPAKLTKTVQQDFEPACFVALVHHARITSVLSSILVSVVALDQAMENVRNYGDRGQTFTCVYCAGADETRDHVPSKVFLDEPYPDDLPVVPACQSCNEGFALDEEYVACLVECALAGSVNPAKIHRDKIREILSKRPALASRLEQARHQTLFNEISFAIEPERVRNVALKLARGHAAFELNEPQFDEPLSVAVLPLRVMAEEQRDQFESPPASATWPFAGWPEVGSRAMQRIVAGETWVVVQPNRYRYLASADDGVVIWMVLSEYLACEVRWE